MVDRMIMKQQCFCGIVLRLLATLALSAAVVGCASLATVNGIASDNSDDNLTVSEQLSRRLDQGKKHKDAGRIEEAITAYQGVLVLSPGNVDARNALAMLLAMNGDLEGAARELARAVKDQPNVPWLLSNLGHVYILQGRKREAQVMLTKALARDPYFAGARVNLERADAMPDEDLQERIAKMARDRLPPKSPIAKTRVHIIAIKGAEREVRLLKGQLHEVGLTAVKLEPAVNASTLRIAGNTASPAQQIRVQFRRGFGEAALLIGRQLPGQPILEPSRMAIRGDVRIVLGRDSLTEVYKNIAEPSKVVARVWIPPSARH